MGFCVTRFDMFEAVRSIFLTVFRALWNIIYHRPNVTVFRQKTLSPFKKRERKRESGHPIPVRVPTTTAVSAFFYLSQNSPLPLSLSLSLSLVSIIMASVPLTLTKTPSALSVTPSSLENIHVTSRPRRLGAMLGLDLLFEEKGKQDATIEWKLSSRDGLRGERSGQERGKMRGIGALRRNREA